MSKGIIHQRNIADAAEEWSKICGANRNLARNIINVFDGLKPVNRRILFYFDVTLTIELDEKKFFRMEKLLKVSKITGNVIAEYHPHGDSSVYDAVVRMVQWWKNNHPLLFKEGNFGNPMGDDAGQQRYIHATISPFAKKCFLEDMKYMTVDMVETYTGDAEEPEVLPSRYPYMFLNGVSGVGQGLASNIPPYNLRDILRVTKELMKDPSKPIYIVPDSPTGCYVIDDGQYDDVCNNINLDSTKSKYRCRGIATIDEIKNIITITSVPFNTTTKGISTVIADNQNQFPEVKDITDDTNEYKVCLNIELKPDVNPQKFLDKLYKKTTLEKTYPITLVMIDNYDDRDFTIKSALLRWIEIRRDCVAGLFINQLNTYMEDYHVYEILIFMSNADNAEKTMEITKRHKKSELKGAFMKAYGITSLQAAKIANMSMSAFASDANEEYVAKAKELKKKIDEVDEKLSDVKYIDEFIIEQLDEGDKLFGHPRLSPIISLDKKNIANKEVLVAISRDGFAKKVKMKTPSIGKVGTKNMDYTLIKINEREDLLIFDKSGRVSKVPTSAIPMVGVDDVGISLKRYFTVADDIICMMQDISDAKLDDKAHVAFITEKGFSKKTNLGEFNKIKDYKLGINLDDNDSLAAIIILSEKDKDEIIVYTNSGKGMKLDPVDSIKEYSRNSKGLCLTKLAEDERFVGADIIDAKYEYLAYITSTGRMKITETKYLPTVERKSGMLNLINLDEGEQLVGIVSVNRESVITIYKKSGEPQEIELSSMDISTRVSKAEKIIKLRRGDAVIAYKVKM